MAYLLAGGVMLSDDMPAEAGDDAGLAMPEEEPELEPIELDGVVVSVLEGDGVVDGEGDGELMGAGAVASSAFLPQAPRASIADKATAVTATDLEVMEYM